MSYSVMASPTTRLLVQRLNEANNKDTIKDLQECSFLRETTGHQWIPHTKGQWYGKCVHAIMPSFSFISFMVQVAGPWYLQFVSFLHADMTQVVKILPHVIQGLTYTT